MSNGSSNSMSRRQVLAAGAIAAAGIGFPRILTAQDKSGTKRPVIGAGEYQYEVIHDWARPPASIAFGNTHGVCEDSQGRIYIKHTVHSSSQSGDAICVFDADGAFVRSWGDEFRGGAHGLHIRKEAGGEYLYLCDCNRGIVIKTTLSGEPVWKLAAPMESGLYNTPAEFKPTNVAVAPNNDLYIADGYGKSWIHRYSCKTPGELPTYVGAWGGPGKERGQLSCPHGLMIDTRGKEPLVCVADRSNRRLQFFSLDGRHIAFVSEELRSPCHFDTRGDVLLVPDLDARVTLLDRNNKLICHLGDGENFGLRDKPREQFVPGKFIAPHSGIFDRAGNIFIVEWVEVGRVTKMRKLS